MRHPEPGEWTSEQYSRGKVASYKPFNFVDGEGVRNSLYVSGCLFACAGCYNKVAQSFSYGECYTPELEERILKDLEPVYVLLASDEGSYITGQIYGETGGQNIGL